MNRGSFAGVGETAGPWRPGPADPVLFAVVSAALGGVPAPGGGMSGKERPHGADGGVLGSGRAARRADGARKPLRGGGAAGAVDCGRGDARQRGVAPGVEDPPKIAPARRGSQSGRGRAGPRGLRGWPFPSPTRAGDGGSRASSEADRLAAPEAALEGDAVDVWRDVIAARRQRHHRQRPPAPRRAAGAGRWSQGRLRPGGRRPGVGRLLLPAGGGAGARPAADAAGQRPGRPAARDVRLPRLHALLRLEPGL